MGQGNKKQTKLYNLSQGNMMKNNSVMDLQDIKNNESILNKRNAK